MRGFFVSLATTPDSSTDISANNRNPKKMADRDILFMLKRSFEDGPGKAYFCPHCAELSGVLAYFPEMHYRLDIRYVDFARPRQELVVLLGEANQNCPVLILASPPPLDATELVTGQVGGRFFVNGPKAIANYWSHVQGISRPH
jgi:hypothetical protein